VNKQSKVVVSNNNGLTWMMMECNKIDKETYDICTFMILSHIL